MSAEVAILIVEAMVLYFLVLWAHSLRHRFGPVHFYALVGGITFVVGSTVFYTSLLPAVFVIYGFDGPRATRIAISTVVSVSILMPLIAVALSLQIKLVGASTINAVPLPSMRINASSVLTTVVDLVFLAMAWEYFGKPN